MLDALHAHITTATHVLHVCSTLQVSMMGTCNQCPALPGSHLVGEEGVLSELELELEAVGLALGIKQALAGDILQEVQHLHILVLDQLGGDVVLQQNGGPELGNTLVCSEWDFKVTFSCRIWGGKTLANKLGLGWV